MGRFARRRAHVVVSPPWLVVPMRDIKQHTDVGPRPRG